MRPTSVPAAYRQRPGNGSGPRVALARDTMRGPGERACHKSKPMHQHGTSKTSLWGCLSPEATMSPARQSSQHWCSLDGFRGRGSSLQSQSPTWARRAPQSLEPRFQGRMSPHRPSNSPLATAAGRAQRPSRALRLLFAPRQPMPTEIKLPIDLASDLDHRRPWVVALGRPPTSDGRGLGS